MDNLSPSPLAGKRVVVTRPELQSASLANKLKIRHSSVIFLPLIQILPPADSAPLDAAAANLSAFDWIIFTSQNAVASIQERLASRGGFAGNLPVAPRIAAVGEATAEAAQRAGFAVTYTGQGGTAATLVHELASQLSGKRVLLPRSDRAAADLVPRLQRFAAVVTDVIAYRTVDVASIDPASREAVAHSDALLFFSPSAVHSFVTLQKANQLAALSDTIVVGAVGPVTSVALRNVGLRCDFQSSDPSVDEIVATLAVHFETLKTQSASGANP